MEYYPSASEQAQDRLFARKKIALNRILKSGLELPYISGIYSYEQLLANYIVQDISNSETNYLKEGIEVLFKCLKEIQKQPILTKQLADKEVYDKNKEYIDKFLNTTGHDDIIQWIEKNSSRLIESDSSSKKTTEDVLIREISEFKIRLGRVNIIMKIDNEVLEFKDTNKMTELHIYEKEIIENPHPNIFSCVEGFLLFQSLHSIYKDIDKPLANYSFIYRQLALDGFIKDTFKPEKFRDWINDEQYDAKVDTKFKTYDNCYTKEKFNFYQFVKSKQ